MEFIIDVSFNAMAVSLAFSVLWLAYQTVRTVRRHASEPKSKTPALAGSKELERELAAIFCVFSCRRLGTE